MIVKKELLNKIKDYFSLNEYETKVWLALLSKGVASAGEISELSNVPRSRTYDVLESLEKRGFAIERLGKPVKYLGVKPQTVIEKLKREASEQAEERVNTLANIKETNEFEQLEELYKTGVQPVKRENLSASLTGKSNISNYLREILQNAKKEVIVVGNSEEVMSKARLFKDTFDKLKKSNIKIRIALSGNEEITKRLEKLFDIKITKINIDAKFFIVDRKEILLYIAKEEKGTEDIAVWLNSEFFVQSFATLFDKATKEK